VKITGTGMIVRDVAWRLGQARTSRGETEIVRILDWAKPPESGALGRPETLRHGANRTGSPAAALSTAFHNRDQSPR